MKWMVPDQEVEKRGLEERLCTKDYQACKVNGRMPWIVVDEAT